MTASSSLLMNSPMSLNFKHGTARKSELLDSSLSQAGHRLRLAPAMPVTGSERIIHSEAPCGLVNDPGQGTATSLSSLEPAAASAGSRGT
jgi:hypothetical protein